MPAEALDVAEAQAINDELCRRSLVDYAMSVLSFALSPWQVDLCQKLQLFVESIERGEGPRLMIFVPPQCGKSTIVSRVFPAWILGKHPEWPGIIASYAAALAAGHGRWIRDVLRGEHHRRIFPICVLSDDSQAKDTMATTAGGQLLARGVTGGTTGNPAMFFVVDDPFADRQEADSSTVRNNVDDWYTSVATTRLGPGGGVLLMHTRWHLDDLAGRLIERQDTGGDRWEVISRPAIADGVALDCRFSLEEFQRKQANMPVRDWQSLYQQTPIPDGGALFKLEWLRYGTPLESTRVYCGWDLASSSDGDYSAGVIMSLDALGRYWLLDVIRGRWDSGELVERMCDLFEEWEPSVSWIEGGPIGKAVWPWLQKRRMERRLMTGRIELVPHTWGGDKIAKAATAVGIAQSGNLFLPSKSPWLSVFRGELAQFPSGKNDDQVDALGIVCHHVLRFLPNVVRPELPARKNMAIITGDDLDRIERESRRSREVKRRR